MGHLSQFVDGFSLRVDDQTELYICVSTLKLTVASGEYSLVLFESKMEH